MLHLKDTFKGDLHLQQCQKKNKFFPPERLITLIPMGRFFIKKCFTGEKKKKLSLKKKSDPILNTELFE